MAGFAPRDLGWNLPSGVSNPLGGHVGHVSFQRLGLPVTWGLGAGGAPESRAAVVVECVICMLRLSLRVAWAPPTARSLTCLGVTTVSCQRCVSVPPRAWGQGPGALPPACLDVAHLVCLCFPSRARRS